MYVVNSFVQAPAYAGHVQGLGLSVWWVVPFLSFLLMIATGPLFYPRFWHRYYAYISVGLCVFVAFYYIFILHHGQYVVHTAVEYVQFISLLTALYFASSGIRITLNTCPRPLTNTLFLLVGGVLANVIGTTGASMLLIRPFISLNQPYIRPYHVVFFIFVVSNIGGALTPVGDPPLFLGFLKGVPFFWTFRHNFWPWCVTLGLVLVIYYLIDSCHLRKQRAPASKEMVCNSVWQIEGKHNGIWLLIVVGAVFLDPNIFTWVPAISYHGEDISFVREVILLGVAFFSYRFANKVVLKDNQFSFFPIREVALVFIGIFGTMMPALELVNQFAGSDAGRLFFTPTSLYWSTGILSGFLDNAPTYLTFFAAAMASHGGNIDNSTEVLAYASQTGQFAGVASATYLWAISLAAVFFGAMTYIGNGPNFMVRSIARQQGINMPYFFAYMMRYAIPILLPIYVLVWWVFLH